MININNTTIDIEFVPVTDDEIQLAVQFLSDLDFVPAAEETPAE